MHAYHFRTDWPVNASAERVWDSLIHAERWPEWGKMFRRVSIRGSQRELSPGALTDAEVKGLLPFVLRFTLEVVRFEPPRILGLHSSGDVVGDGRWEVEDEPGGSSAVFYWDVGLSNRFLDALGRLPVTERLLAWNHDNVMRKAFAGFRSQVEAVA